MIDMVWTACSIPKKKVFYSDVTIIELFNLELNWAFGHLAKYHKTRDLERLSIILASWTVMLGVVSLGRWVLLPSAYCRTQGQEHGCCHAMTHWYHEEPLTAVMPQHLSPRLTVLPATHSSP